MKAVKNSGLLNTEGAYDTNEKTRTRKSTKFIMEGKKITRSIPQ